MAEGKGSRPRLEPLRKSLFTRRPSTVHPDTDPESGTALDTSALVRSLYDGLLHREASASEIESWVDAMRGGLPLAAVVSEFDSSPEHMQVLRQRKPVLPPPAADSPSLTILDIGAQVLEGEDDPFRPLLNSGNCRVIGLEPLEDSHATRTRQDPNWTLLPHFAGDGTRRTFYETEWGPTSSLYEPNHDGIGDFAGLDEICQVVKTVEVDTVRLDDIIDEPVHLLKLDVQGAELDVLRGAERLLKDILVIHSEVEFYPIYRGQPLFDSVFEFLTSHDFEIFDLLRQTKYSYQGADEQLERLLWAEAIFVPSRDRIDGLDAEDTRRLARIMRDNYGAAGFSQWILDRHDERTQRSSATSG
jgi:FkbM family methyltransferase